jgi:hypothetical protein
MREFLRDREYLFHKSGMHRDGTREALQVSAVISRLLFEPWKTNRRSRMRF